MDENEQKKQDAKKAEDEAKDKEDAIKAKEAGDKKDENRIPAIDDAKKAAQELRDATAAQKIENDRTEKLTAEAELGGQSKMSKTDPVRTPEDQASRARIKAVGDACAAPWAKNYE